jgi:signal transduction histidine kinase
MIAENNSSQGIGEVFATLADLINRLPVEERTKLRAGLGAYSHDLKNTLGVITGANALICRIPPQAEAAETVLEMAGIIENATGQMDELIMLLVEDLNNQIDTP